MSAETERHKKMSPNGKNGLRVNQVGTSSAPSNSAQGQSGQACQSESVKSVKKETKPNSLVTALEAVQSDLASLKQAFDKAHTPAERNMNERYRQVNQPLFRRRTCSACCSAGIERCEYCFKCGSNDHFARGWKKSVVWETRRGCIHGTGCSQRSQVPCLQILCKDGGCLNSVVVAKPYDIVQENVNRNTGGIIESYVRPYLLCQSKSIERTGRKQGHFIFHCRRMHE